ncbi:penicillin-binding protein [Candidatus Roizmanbacteria bacterium]|nr:penicillin-binding protein [Candidatus Roizmanbacteria bacterium]
MKEKINHMHKKIKAKIDASKHRKKIYFLLISIPTILFATFIYFYIFYQLPSPMSLKDYKVIPLSTHILDRNGKLLYEIFKEEKRTLVKVKELPIHVKQATIATEDKNFYKHGGISFVGGILRAIKDTILKRKLQGGSTITQQLVKSALLTPERTVRRKLREIALAFWTESIFSKDEILELYLNQVPYGGSAYGIEEAAQLYFAKHAKNLTLTEAAFLAGLPQAPSLYSPYLNPDLALKRRNGVLKAMLEEKYIKKGAYEKFAKVKLFVQPIEQNIRAPHFTFYVKSQLEEIYGIKQVEEGGLQVTTTLDLDIQEQAEKVLKEELEKIKDLNVSNGAILVTRPPTGEILSMVGSVDYFASPSGAFNVTTALRQPGSAIKPLNYAIGIERKIVSPATVFLDIPTCFFAAGQPTKYCPKNYDGVFHGVTQLRFALGDSYNIPAVKMLAINGVENFVASSSAFTITTFKDPKNYGLSLTLGGGEVKMTEMAQAFSVFPNRGIPKKLNAILQVKNKKDKILYKYKDSNFVKDVKKSLQSPNFFAIQGNRAISAETAFIISHILLDNNARSSAFGSSSFLVVTNKAVSVKTGTTDDKKDNWTIGYTPNFLTSVWVGNNDNTPMNPYLTSGVTGAAPIWNKVMSYVLKNQSDLWPVRPQNVVGRQVCWDTGNLMNKNPDGSESCKSRFEYFIKGTENISNEVKVEKTFVPVNRDTGKMTTVDDPAHEMKEKNIIRDKFSTYCTDCTPDYPVPATSPTPTP